MYFLFARISFLIFLIFIFLSYDLFSIPSLDKNLKKHSITCNFGDGLIRSLINSPCKFLELFLSNPILVFARINKLIIFDLNDTCICNNVSNL